MDIKSGDVVYVANKHKFVVSKGRILKTDHEKVYIQTFINDTELNPTIFDIYLSNISNSFHETEIEAKADLGLYIYHNYRDYVLAEKDIPVYLNYVSLTLAYKEVSKLIDYASELYPEKMI